MRAWFCVVLCSVSRLASAANEPALQPIVEVPSASLSLMVRDQADCFVSLDDLALGYAPLFRHPVPSGSHLLNVRCRSGASFKRMVRLPPGGNARVLEPVGPQGPPAHGEALLRLAVPGQADCAVTVGGKSIGAAPLYDALLPAGEHDVVVYCKSGWHQRTKVRLREGAVTKLIFHLPSDMLLSLDQPQVITPRDE